jgi:hypothetical protein
MADEIIAPQVEEVVESTENTPETLETVAETPADSANPAEKSAEPTKAEIKKLKKLMLKVDGQDIEENLPFDIDDKPEIVEYLKKQLQLAKVSQKRMAQTSTLEKEIGALLTALKENPEEVLSDPNLGVDIEALARRVIEKKIEQSKKTPEQLEQEKVQARLKELEEKLKAKEDEIKGKERQQLEEKMFTEYNNSIDSALKEANLPVNRYMKGKVADYMLLGVKNGVDVKPADVLALVKKDIQAELQEMFNVMPSETVGQLIGKDTIKKFQPKPPAKKPISTPASATKVVDAGGKKAEEPQKKSKENLGNFKPFKGLGFN